MKFEELNREQQEHFLKLLNKVGGEVPRGATHFDMNDETTSGWLMLNGEGYVTYFTNGLWKYYDSFNLSDDYLEMVKIPEKPYYDPADVSLNNKGDNKMIIQINNSSFIEAIAYIKANNPYMKSHSFRELKKTLKDLINNAVTHTIETGGNGIVSTAGFMVMSEEMGDDFINVDILVEASFEREDKEYLELSVDEFCEWIGE